MNDTNRNGSDLSPEATTGSMDPYGLRAMRYVQDHCPNRFATITNPTGFFKGRTEGPSISASQAPGGASGSSAAVWG